MVLRMPAKYARLHRLWDHSENTYDVFKGGYADSRNGYPADFAGRSTIVHIEGRAAINYTTSVIAEIYSPDLRDCVHKKAVNRWRGVRSGGVLGPLECGSVKMRHTLWNELREMVWLVSVIGALSMLGVGLAVALAVA
jgi:hypothetical protein